MKSSLFEITRPSPSRNASGSFAVAAPRGLAVGYRSGFPNEFDLASGTNYVGHLTRDITTAGPTLADRVFGVSGATPVGPEFPDKAGDYVTAEKADEIEAEGSDLLLTSGTGSLSSGTPVGTPLSFFQGKFRVKQAADTAFYMLTAVWTADADVNTSGNLRIRAERI